MIIELLRIKLGPMIKILSLTALYANLSQSLIKRDNIGIILPASTVNEKKL